MKKKTSDVCYKYKDGRFLKTCYKEIANNVKAESMIRDLKINELLD